MDKLKAHPARLEAALHGLTLYQQAERAALQPVFAPLLRHGGVCLRTVPAHACAANQGDKPTLVVIPSLINAPDILDLAPDRSLVRYLAAQGFRVLLVDWGPMGRSERRLGLSGLVSQRLMPLLQQVPGPVSLLGYCLGGTIAIAAAQLLGAKLARLALIATPWHFSAFPDSHRTQMRRIWPVLQQMGQTLGAVPVSALNPFFWALDPDTVVEKFERLGRYPAGDPHVRWFAKVEDWANSGAPLPLPVVRDLFVRGYAQDWTGGGRWKVSGQVIDPYSLSAPLADFGSATDKIVPPQARINAAHIHKQDSASGHVGLIISASARSHLWEPLSNWLGHG